ncbi:mitochondrial 37S ribosomal protein bS21m [Lipomyces chichibuensis]|uniref:mitochondrial 37S ribosomal protein bS21m n=1 Tax=Lipomyces chichibuensis TaxID=1546026 RepID=UPI003343D410
MSTAQNFARGLRSGNLFRLLRPQIANSRCLFSSGVPWLASESNHSVPNQKVDAMQLLRDSVQADEVRSEPVGEPTEKSAQAEAVPAQATVHRYITLGSMPRVGPYAGRSFEVASPELLPVQLLKLRRLVTANEVHAQTLRYKSFEKPNSRRKRLRIERTQKLFNKSYGQMVNKMKKYWKMGY